MKGLKRGLMYSSLGFILSNLIVQDLKSQNNEFCVKAGLSFNNTTVRDNSKVNAIGVETVMQQGLSKKLSLEWEFGMYFPINQKEYSKLQTNLGIKYMPLSYDNWNLGIKGSIGGSSEMYITDKEIINKISGEYESRKITKTIELQLEKRLQNKTKIDLALSKEIDRPSWKIGIRKTFR